MSGLLLMLFGLATGLCGGLALHAVTRPRGWHPRLRRLRRYLLGEAWRPILLSPHVPAQATPPPAADNEHTGASSSSSSA